MRISSGFSGVDFEVDGFSQCPTANRNTSQTNSATRIASVILSFGAASTTAAKRIVRIVLLTMHGDQKPLCAGTACGEHGLHDCAVAGCFVGGNDDIAVRL